MRRRAVANVYWSAWGRLGGLFSSLFIGILVARYLGKEQYGLMNYVITLVMVFQVFARFGMDAIETRELASGRIARDVILGTAFRIKLILAVITYLAIAAMTFSVKSDPQVRVLILCYATTTFFNCFSLIRNYFTAMVRNVEVTKVELCRLLISALFKIFLLLIHASLVMFILAYVLDALLLANGYIWMYRRKAGKISLWQYDRGVAKMLLADSFPLLVSGLMVVGYQRIDQLMLMNMIDANALGVYSVASRLTEALLFLPPILIQTLVPILISIREKNPSIYPVRAQQFVSLIVWISLVTAGAVSVASYFLIMICFGTEYLAAVPVLQIMVFKAVGSALATSSGKLIILENQQRWEFVRNFVACVVCVALNTWAIPRYGLVGAAWVAVVTIFAGGFLANLFIPQYYKYFIIQVRALLWGWFDALQCGGDMYRSIFKK